MGRRKPGSLAELMAHARKALGMTQAEFGPALGSSKKTALRWEWGSSTPDEPAMEKLLSLLAPVDPELAMELAAAAGIALAPAPPAQVPAELPAMPALPEVTLDDRAELVVHAAAEAMELPPAAVRPLLFAATERAIALGLTIEQLAASLRLRVRTSGSDSAKTARVAGVRVATKPATPDEAETDSPSPRRARAH